jgi:hypothetical protein
LITIVKAPVYKAFRRSSLGQHRNNFETGAGLIGLEANFEVEPGEFLLTEDKGAVEHFIFKNSDV